MTYAAVNKIGISLNERLDKLEFYKDELDMLRNRLIEVTGKNTNSDVQRDAGHFQNEFDIGQQNISDLQHRTRSCMHNCEEDVKFHNGNVSTTVSGNINALDKEIALFEKQLNELSADFKKFLSR